MSEQLDVIAVHIDTRRIRVVAQNLSERNAEAVISMAVMRRGAETEFFDSVPSGKYQDGDLKI